MSAEPQIKWMTFHVETKIAPSGLATKALVLDGATKIQAGVLGGMQGYFVSVGGEYGSSKVFVPWTNIASVGVM